jgi:hypothetical protein
MKHRSYMSLEQVLADVSNANALCKRYPVKPEHRLRFSLTCRGLPGGMLCERAPASQEHTCPKPPPFWLELPLMWKLATLVGAVMVDVELVDVGARTNHPTSPSATTGADNEGDSGPSLRLAGDFEKLQACRTASLQQFYGRDPPDERV